MKIFYQIAVGVSMMMALTMAIALFLPLPSSQAIVEDSISVLSSTAEDAPKATTISLLFFGDIMLGRNVEGLTNKHGDDYPFAKITDLIQSVDLAFANLEGPIVHEHTQTPTGSFVFSFKETTGAVLAAAGFDGVSLANNHTLNQGDDGFAETEVNLDAAGVLHVGHPIDMSQDYVVHTVVNGLPLTLVGFNMTFAYDDPDAAVATIAKLAGQSDEQIIVMMHWGDEYQPHSNAAQENLAHRLIDAGADLIIGAHPHVVQEVERYNDKLIFYSLGNFIFDQYFSVPTQQELAVGIEMTDDGVQSATLYPIESVLSQPALMDELERSQFLQAIAERSDSGLSEMIIHAVIH